MGKRNRIYENLHNFVCQKRDDKTGKPCNGHLHPTNHFSSTLEFYCHTCEKYTTMSYQIANIIVNDTGMPPKMEKGSN